MGFVHARHREGADHHREAPRDELGIGAGSEIEFTRAVDALVIRKVTDSTSRGRQLVERLRRRGDVTLTTDEIMALTRGA